MTRAFTLRVAVATVLCLSPSCFHMTGTPAATDGARTPASPDVIVLANTGFDGPENLVYDSAADVFLVSNMGGKPAERDDNGFISRVSPDGRVLSLKWIAGSVGGAVLDAPGRDGGGELGRRDQDVRCEADVDCRA